MPGAEAEDEEIEVAGGTWKLPQEDGVATNTAQWTVPAENNNEAAPPPELPSTSTEERATVTVVENEVEVERGQLVINEVEVDSKRRVVEEVVAKSSGKGKAQDSLLF